MWRTARGELRPAYGVAGNFILGPAIAGKVITQGFSGSIGLLKTESSLAAFDSNGKTLASISAVPGLALFAFSPSGGTALAYLAANDALIEWSGSEFVPVFLAYEKEKFDNVLGIAFPSPAEATLIVQREETIRQLNVSLGGAGSISQKTLPGVHAPLLFLPSGDIVYREDGGIVIRRTDSSEVHIGASLPASFSLQQMNQEWVQLTDFDSSARFAIRTTPGREAFFRLPEGGK